MMVQLFIGLPSTSTAHAPHCARSQPRLLLESPSWKFIVSQRLSRLSTMRSCCAPSMFSVTRRIVAGIGPVAVVFVADVSGLTTFLTTTAPPRTTPAVAAPAPAPMRKSRRVTEKPLPLLCVCPVSATVPGSGLPPASPIEEHPHAHRSGRWQRQTSSGVKGSALVWCGLTTPEMLGIGGNRPSAGLAGTPPDEADLRGRCGLIRYHEEKQVCDTRRFRGLIGGLSSMRMREIYARMAEL